MCSPPSPSVRLERFARGGSSYSAEPKDGNPAPSLGAYSLKKLAKFLRYSETLGVPLVKDCFRRAAESLIGICMCASLTWYTAGGTKYLLRAFWSYRFWSNIGSSFHGVFSSVGAVFAFLFYASITLVALSGTLIAIFVTVLCVKRFFFGLAGKTKPNERLNPPT
jgi:hypothetical protein